eukprot:GHVO01067370.1.p1 GENE.GHVO01067370.1~~GHVO01067370.1.p1  ORF type:complete len:329 (+),score=44.80 GHVO01067370.1:52-1038(+)
MFDETNLVRTAIENDNGLTLQMYNWKPKTEASATLLLVHGLCGHARDYLHAPDKIETEEEFKLEYEGSWVQGFNDRGYDVYAYDAQGHGESDSWRGSRGNVERFDHYVDDTLLVLKCIVKSARTPVYLCGNSLGGSIVLYTLSIGLSNGTIVPATADDKENKPRGEEIAVAGAILLAPAISMSKELSENPLNRFAIPLLKVLSKMAPTLHATRKVSNPMFPQIDRMMEIDPLCHKGGYLAVRIARELLRAAQSLRRVAKQVRGLPVLIVHSTRDAICDFEATRGFFEKLEAEPKKLVIIDDMCHHLIREPQNERILDIVLEWLGEIRS